MRSNGAAERSKPKSRGGEAENSQRDPRRGPGRLSIVSLGPGRRAYLIPRALEALTAAEVLVGYKTYLDLIEELTAGKIVVASGMRKEIDRCQAAIDHAIEGNRVALISSGDAGIYGMAGLVFDLCRERQLRIAGDGDTAPAEVDFYVEVVPGVAAFNAAASLVGAPLMHDFAAISLSDHLTPWEVIEKRLTSAAVGDFVLALYNPRSKSRPQLLEQAREILLRHRSPQTPVAIVQRAMREGQKEHLSNLADLPCDMVDMQSIVLVGNSQTYVWDGWMITPRGYLKKYSVEEG